MDRKTRSNNMGPVKTCCSFKDTHRLKVKGWKRILHANGNQERSGMAILISGKIDSKSVLVTKDKEGYY